jgi:hypothetical protein
MMRIHNLTAMILCITVDHYEDQHGRKTASLRIADCLTKAESRFFMQPNVFKGTGERRAKMEPKKEEN